MYVYILTETGPEYWLWTVGFYSPKGEWYPESDWNNKEDAANRVNFLNGNKN